MSWDDLRYVLAVLRERTLSAAGAALGVTHTTVGRRLRAIEEALGVRLFDRTPEGFAATPAGEDVARVAEGIEAEVLALEGRVMGRDARLQGALRVATMDMLLRRYQGVIAGFCARYPSVELTVVSSDEAASLERREADVALRLSNSPPPHLVGRRVARVEFAVYASRALAERVGADVPEGALPWGALPWLGWDRRLDTGRWHDGWLAEHAPGARVVLRLDAASVQLRELVRAGVGAHFLPVWEGAADDGLVQVGPVVEGAARDVWLLTLPELRQTSRIRAFIDHMVDEIGG